ncbi:AraC family transcriptional regulator [Paenibacillus methanolicus]|uniref:AraC family transcriptional regulator n=1 Tax=Paenibacillus methanolicus TaxID=582686 RepID=A0A5S5C6P2_9BACL|nr:AraC family transcriptional regulator [Paenibacillus methanolicus]TYP74142.1 AraC family transcriptional regulator [Paenibacillus methanolicus]
MDSIQNMNRALAYIEANLDDEIDFGQVARIASCSEHQFNRMFSFLSGVGLSEYIRNRRLTLAAMELQSGTAKVIDVALKYGYNSPDSFSRAFQHMHGVAPSLVKENGSLLKAYPPMTFQLTIKGGAEMNFYFVEKEAFNIVGIKETVDTTGGNFHPEIWNELENDDLLKKLEQFSNTDFQGILHVNANITANSRDYYISVATTKDDSQEFTTFEIPAATWSVFKTSGPQPDTMLKTWERIYAEWLPSSGYELAESIEFVRDLNDPTDLSAYEIWVPVKKR